VAAHAFIVNAAPLLATLAVVDHRCHRAPLSGRPAGRPS
jgi:hypothetical protein